MAGARTPRSPQIEPAAVELTASHNVDINRLIREITATIQAHCPPAIQYELHLDDELPAAGAPSAQLESLVKLLCIYAERCIHSTGRIFISTSHVEPSGREFSNSLTHAGYVSLDVEIAPFEDLLRGPDDGEAVRDAEINESLNAADLVAISVIVRECGGAVRVSSELHCERVSIYLPSVEPDSVSYLLADSLSESQFMEVETV